MKKFPKILLIAFLFVCAIGATFFITLHEAQKLAVPQAQSAAGSKIDEIMEYMDYYFVDEYDEDAMSDAAAAALLDANGDRWSYYLSAAEYQDYLETVNNAYVGIGVTILTDEDAGGMRIETVTAGSPAEAAGIQVGDVIVSVEGQSTLELGMDGTRDIVRGEAGTSVHMELLRDGETLEVDVQRGTIETPVAAGELLDGGVGYISIVNFDDRCSNEVIACIEELRAAGAKALLFDVRFNPGGYQEELVKVLDYLLPEGVIFKSVDFQGNEETEYSDASCVELPMAVLVNEDSYSAAEYFAAALQEYGVADVIGMSTVGKGNYQNGFELSDGSFLNISTGKYFTPQGKSLTDVGITPDVEIDLSDENYAALYYSQLAAEDDAQLQAALELLLDKIA